MSQPINVIHVHLLVNDNNQASLAYFFNLQKMGFMDRLRYYLSSWEKVTPEQALKAIRDHWQVDNGLPWVLELIIKIENDAETIVDILSIDAAFEGIDPHDNLRTMRGFLSKQ